MSSLTSLIGGGGGGTPVNSIAQLYVGGQTQYTDESGGVWLKTGNTITPNTSTYPEAIVSNNSVNSATYDDVSLYVGLQMSSAQDLTFNNDGTKMFVIGEGTDRVFAYNLSTAFDLSTAYYSGVNFSVAGQNSSPQDINFNNDGTKMFVISTNTLYQYTLSAAFDLSTASYDNVSFDFSAQEAVAFCFAFNDNGTKMYILGAVNDNVFQYSLGTAYNIATSTYDNVSFNVNAQEGTPYGLAFNVDGTKMFVVGSNNRKVHQYTLSTGFNVSTASYDNLFFSVAAQTTTPYGLAFSNNGDKMYVNTSTMIFEYSLGDPFSLVSVSYDNVSFSILGQDTTPYKIEFNNDGTKMYMLGSNTKKVYQYTLLTAFDLSTARYSQVSLGIQDTAPSALLFNNDGTKMYTLGMTGDRIYQYTLSVAFDLSTAVYDNIFLSLATQDNSPFAMRFSEDGSRFFMLGTTNKKIFQYSLSTPFDISTIVYDGNFLDVSVQDTNLQGITFNSNGTKLYTIGITNDAIYQYSLSGPYNLVGAVYNGLSLYVGGKDATPRDVILNNNSSKLYFLGGNSRTIYQYSLSEVMGLSVPTGAYDYIKLK